MTYGTPEYYAEQFADFLADVQGGSPEYGDNIVTGFLLALEDWKKYHQEQVSEYERVEQRVRQALPV